MHTHAFIIQATVWTNNTALIIIAYKEKKICYSIPVTGLLMLKVLTY